MSDRPVDILSLIERQNDARREAQRQWALTAAVLGPPERVSLWQRLRGWFR